MNEIEDNVVMVPEAGCWIWMGNILRGYGRMPRTQERAHRASYEYYAGPIAPGMCVLHRCDVPSCVNPAHLFLGTQSENMADKVAKGRQKGGGRAISAALAEEIHLSRESLRSLTKRLGIAKSTVAKYRNGT